MKAKKFLKTMTHCLVNLVPVGPRGNFPVGALLVGVVKTFIVKLMMTFKTGGS